MVGMIACNGVILIEKVQIERRNASVHGVPTLVANRFK
jgi:hypothetical protein